MGPLSIGVQAIRIGGENARNGAGDSDLLRQLGRKVEAKRAYDAAIARCENLAEQSFLQRQRQALAGT
ncbi:MAG: hypothetical protein WAU49_12020 [Steroidobacteraceae bacterium]